ncbi:MAG: YfhO family protein [Clostridia bacterium]|nr:YfhO family protein [Clostridia bacterium]
MTLRSMAGGTVRGLNAAGGFLSRPRNPRYLYLTAFFLPVFIMGVIWAVCGVIPFGSKMILAHDQWHQYYPFYINLRERLQNGESLFHSWNTGMGTSYLPLYAYYLASPLNLPAALLPEGLLMPWYTLAVLIRIGLAGLFCAIFLKKTFGRDELAVAFFSTAYALCAFMMGYYWNAIWLDTVALHCGYPRYAPTQRAYFLTTVFSPQ